MRCTHPLLICGLVICAFVACKSNKEIPVVEQVKGEKWTMVKRSGCFGRCPIYTLTIFEGGFAEIEAKRYLEIEGWHQKKINPDTYKALQKAFAASNFLEHPSEYPSVLADLPYTTLGMYIDNKEKTVRGKETLPEELVKIADLMHTIVEAGGWEPFTPVKEKELPIPEEPSYIYDEIIIEPNSGVNLPAWFKSKKELGIHLKKRVHPNLNIWVIGYTQDRYAPTEILEMLKSDPELKSAEFNIRVKGRDNNN